jgi:integrase
MTEDMPRKLPLNVYRERTRHRKWVFYYRVGKGERVRLPAYGTPEFDPAYKAAQAGTPIPSRKSQADAKSLRWLVDRYMESAKWAGLSVATRKQQGLFFEDAITKAGNPDYRAITRKHMANAIDDRKATPFLANNFLKAMRGLFGWAVKNDNIPIDPTVGVEGVRAKSDGFPAWTVEDVTKFCSAYEIGTRPRLAFELILQTGLRRSDICVAGRQHLSGNVLTIRTAKTSTVVTAELPDELLRIIAKTSTGDLAFIVGEHGGPFTKESFGNWFGDCCRKAGVNKSAHGIRKLSATLAANGGSTTHELMAQFGWATTSQAEVYTKGADRVRLGVRTSRVIAEQIEAAKPRTEIAGAGKIQNKSKKSKT